MGLRVFEALLGFLSPTQGGTSPLSIIPGVLIVLYGVWTAAWRAVVTVDPSAKTLQWTRSVFQFVLKKEIWQRDEIKAIESATAGSKHKASAHK